ncbi:MAG: hypothetical protein V4472_09260 [Pseudomonadota bacterium]
MIRISGILLLGAALLVAAADAPRERVVTGEGFAPATVANVPGRFIIDPGAPSMPMLAPDFAARAGLRPGMFAMRYLIGPVTIDGSSAVTRIDTGGGARKRRVAWSVKAYAAGADGVVGPGFLVEDVVRFVLRPARAGERTVSLPMVESGGLLGGWGGLLAQVDVGGQPLKVRFDLRHQRSLATAGAGIAIATALGGRTEGAPESAEIAFGVERPVRRLRLARPLMVGPLAVDRLFVRVADFGDASAIADEHDDPDEVVVTAGKKRKTGRDRLNLGLDQLDRCSSIIFDKPARQIRLTCA